MRLRTRPALNTKLFINSKLPALNGASGFQKKKFRAHVKVPAPKWNVTLQRREVSRWRIKFSPKSPHIIPNFGPIMQRF